jgi:hypothetical protein
VETKYGVNYLQNLNEETQIILKDLKKDLINKKECVEFNSSGILEEEMLIVCKIYDLKEKADDHLLVTKNNKDLEAKSMKKYKEELDKKNQQTNEEKTDLNNES